MALEHRVLDGIETAPETAPLPSSSTAANAIIAKATFPVGIEEKNSKLASRDRKKNEELSIARPVTLGRVAKSSSRY